MDFRIRTVIQLMKRTALPPSNFHTTAVSFQTSLIIHLATEVNLSPSRLRVLFKAETGQTISQFARGLRLEKARQLVVGTFFRISEIATQLDYDDPSHFVREFRQTFGVTPLVYRRINTAGHEQSPQAMNSHFRP